MGQLYELAPVPPGQLVSIVEGKEIELGTAVPSVVTKPRYVVSINDEILPGIAYITLEFSSFGMNATFTLDGVYSVLGNTNIGSPVDPNSILAKLLGISTKFRNVVRIFTGYSDSESPSVDELEETFVGILDDIQVDITKNHVAFMGRDLTAIFQESYTHEQFRNRTSGSVVREIVEDAMEGFPEIQIGTIEDPGTPIGTAFDYEHIDFQNLGPEGYNLWEILMKLADADGFKMFFKGNKFYYVPFEYSEGSIRFELGVNVETLTAKKNYSVANSRVRVEIASSDVRRKDNIVAVIGPASGAGSKGDRVEIRKVIPGISAVEAGIYAEALALFYAQFEHVITITSAGAPIQSILKELVLLESGTVFDRRYRIMGLSWQMGVDLGWQAEFNCVNVPDEAFIQGHRQRQRTRLGTKA